ncbi:MAG: lysophospholipid acyltransferase family protein [Thermodesulfobacteriota bacterium]
MPYTVHDTPVVRPLMRCLAIVIFKIAGWQSQGQKPDIPRYVIIAAPHTSNWDFLYTVCLAFLFRIKPLIMMKAEWFRWPMGPFFRWLGAIPVDRSKSNNVVTQSISKFQETDELVMIIPPSGTRRRVMYWKTGFYHIANGAGVPIVLGYLDYGRKTGGIGPAVIPTGDIESDMATIRDFYSGIEGRHPLNSSTYVKADNSTIVPS